MPSEQFGGHGRIAICVIIIVSYRTPYYFYRSRYLREARDYNSTLYGNISDNEQYNVLLTILERSTTWQSVPVPARRTPVA